mmetsp:Transcript_74701/g.188081  ORF Transcript_74701/g.188081 Transcript_74701/m.188081 type:complete len:370 (-) Transcript_74701:1095-2204(-)
MLELVPGICNAVEAGCIILVIIVKVLGPLRDNNHVILYEVKASSFSTARPQGHNVCIVVVLVTAILHLPGTLPQGEPIIQSGISRHLVVPSARCHMLHAVGSFVLNRLCSRYVVQPQHAILLFGHPIKDVVTVHADACPLVVRSDVVLELIKCSLELRQSLPIERHPTAVLCHPPICGLSTNPIHDRRLQLLYFGTDLVQVHLLRLLTPSPKEVGDVFLVAISTRARYGADDVAKLLPANPHLYAVGLVEQHDVVATSNAPRHRRDAPNDIAHGCGLVLVTCCTWRASHDVPQLLRQFWRVIPAMWVGREDAGAKHDDLDTETKEQYVDEHVHWELLIVLELYLSHQGRMIDVPILKAVRHLLLVPHAS